MHRRVPGAVHREAQHSTYVCVIVEDPAGLRSLMFMPGVCSDGNGFPEGGVVAVKVWRGCLAEGCMPFIQF
jgi:hypothetical protein